MTNEVRTLGVKIPQELYDRIREYVSEQSINISDFVRKAVLKLLEDDQPDTNTVGNATNSAFDEHLKAEVEYLRKQLEQVRVDAESSKERSDTIILQLTQQLDNQTKLIEDLRKDGEKKGFLKRLFRKG